MVKAFMNKTPVARMMNEPNGFVCETHVAVVENAEIWNLIEARRVLLESNENKCLCAS